MHHLDDASIKHLVYILKIIRWFFKTFLNAQSSLIIRSVVHRPTAATPPKSSPDQNLHFSKVQGIHTDLMKK